VIAPGFRFGILHKGTFMEIRFGSFRTKPWLVLLSAAGSAIAAPLPGVEVMRVWNNGGYVSIEGYRWNTTSKRFEYAVGGGRRFGGTTVLALLNGDINGDGRADVIHVWNNGGFASIEGYTFNAAENNFQYTSSGATTKLRPADNSEFIAGDVNGDGKTDVVHIRRDNSWSGYDRTVAIYYSNGSTFAQSPNIRYYNDYDGQQNFWLMGKLDKDGRSDMVHVAQTNNVYSSFISSPSSMGYYLAPSTQAFFGTGPNLMGSGSCREFLFGDTDGDGDDDLIGIAPASYIGNFFLSVFENNVADGGIRNVFTMTQSPPTYLAVLSGNLE
jgi:hypothetical protein